MVSNVKTLIIAPCGIRKAPAPAPAREFYTGGYARSCLAFAIALADTLENAGVLILSARYGFVDLENILEPYNVTFGRPGAIAPAELRRQLEGRQLLTCDDVRIVAGARYVATARQFWPDAIALFPRLPGIGAQLAWLKNNRPRRWEQLELEAAP